MDDINDYLAGIAIGVRFRNNYSIEDCYGAISDTLLYSNKNGVLNHITFPYQSKGVGHSELRLQSDSGNSLVININNIIIDINFSQKIPKEKAQNVIDEYFNALTEKIYKIVNIKEVRLIGIVYKYIIDDAKSAKALRNNLKKVTFDDASSISVNFSKKLILPDSKLKKEHNDYENIICTLSMNNESKENYYFQVDYQHIYSPRLASIIDIPYADFADKVKRYNANTISRWIKEHEK